MVNTIKKESITHAWVSSLRLKTLPLACCGIITGTALVIAQGLKMNGWVFLFSLLTAVLLQLVSNLANDYGDMQKGSDTEQRIGPKRGMQYGVISSVQMKWAIIFVGFLSLVSGITLIVLACRTLSDVLAFIVLGGVSLIAAITYTVGKKAYGYSGFGDLSVLTFFGYVGVMGSFYLQTHHIGLYSFLPATACGLLGTLVLNVNNMRDIQEDERNGKRTLAVRLGSKNVRYYHLSLLIGSFSCLVLFASLYAEGNPYIWLFLFALPLFYLNGYAVLVHKDPIQLQKQLAMAVKINVCTLALFSIGLFLT
ncbi:1,4-dihydroxy-2-naphthoate polyprenyltransferase [Neisseria sp. Ec49-e6-T10]|uniref:1,4-dihydroxy-2-naphthoate polyprenyltransferase n=1 Tax=Neisseria sp. Ec49-e6-T10 TaxID=3140744 RepID=UPI003EB81FA6